MVNKLETVSFLERGSFKTRSLLLMEEDGLHSLPLLLSVHFSLSLSRAIVSLREWSMGGRKRRFAVLLCAEESEYVRKKYGGYFGVFVRMLAGDDEEWKVYRVAAGEFPGEDELSGYEGYVITGSCNDAHGDDIWICKLMNLLIKLNAMKKKVLGICFGHQILSRALGGKTGRAISGWDIGITTIHLSRSSKLFSSLKIPSPLSVIECHRDEVRELPAGAEVIGWSEKTGIEMFTFGDHMMGVQGHPEYTKDILLHLIDRLVQRTYITDADGQVLKDKVEEGEADREAWKKICIEFLKGGLGS